MKVPYSWLKELVPNLEGPHETADVLTAIGLNVEEVIEVPAAPDSIVVVRVESSAPLEGTESLTVAVVWDGSVSRTVISGATIGETGSRFALALPGAQLPGQERPIGKQEIGGRISEGMLCSAKELGLYNESATLMQLPEDVPVGALLRDHWPADFVLDVELTPNRADAASILGVARDLAVKLGTNFRNPSDQVDIGDASDNFLTLQIDAPEACPRMTARIVENVNVGPSPLWLQRRLALVGANPRFNIVDVTNYVMFELGQPSHAFDRTSLGADTLIVRQGAAGEHLSAIGGQKLTLGEQSLVIATPDEPNSSQVIALAGVIGSTKNSVSHSTRSVVLEVAHFEPVAIRKSAKDQRITTDASYRFERGVDPNLPALASARIGELIEMIGAGMPNKSFADTGYHQTTPRITYSPGLVQRVTGVEVDPIRQKDYLERLGCKIHEEANDWVVTPPSWRFDMSIPEDIVEEIIRLHGYDHIPETNPEIHFTPSSNDVTYRNLRHRLAAIGFLEILSYVFVSSADLLHTGSAKDAIEIESPLTPERNMLRTSLRPGLLHAARLNRSSTSNAFFEIGHVFGECEYECLGLLVQGDWITGLGQPRVKADFFVLKGILESLGRSANVAIELKATQALGYHPGICAEVFWDGHEIGCLGRVHPQVEEHFGLGPTYLAELRLPLSSSSPMFSQYSRQQWAARDLAIIAPEKTPYAEIATLIANCAGKYLEQVQPFDVYNDVGDGLKSVGVRVRFQRSDRTLRVEEVDALLDTIIEALQNAGLRLRQ